MSTQYIGKGENFYSLGDNSDWSLNSYKFEVMNRLGFLIQNYKNYESGKLQIIACLLKRYPATTFKCVLPINFTNFIIKDIE